MSDPIITRLEVHQWTSSLPELGRDYNGFNLVYEPGGNAKIIGHVVRIFTDQSGSSASTATGPRSISARCPCSCTTSSAEAPSSANGSTQT